MDASPDEADAALPPMALLAALQTAETVRQGVSERRAGRDPAAQQPAQEARAYLAAAAAELTRLHMQILMANVQAERQAERTSPHEASSTNGPVQQTPPPSARLAATVRRFDLLMKLRRTGHLLHGAHQRLLSLYPAVSEELVEEARRCQGSLTRLHAAAGHEHGPDDDDDDTLALFLQRLLSFAAWMEREV